MPIAFKNNIQNIKTTSFDYHFFDGGNCPEPCLGQFFLEYIPICNQVPRPVISTIVDPYMLFYENWEIITEIFDSWKIQNVSIFYFWKNSPKMNVHKPFTLYSKGRHFSITKLGILILCNILHLEIYFWNLSSKRIVSL